MRVHTRRLSVVSRSAALAAVAGLLGSAALAGCDARSSTPAEMGGEAVSLSQTVAPEARLIASGGEDRQAFGHALAVEGAVAVVTSAGHPAFRADGVTRVLERRGTAATSWTEVATLGDPDGATRARLGVGDWVAVQGRLAFVGSGVAFGERSTASGSGLDVYGDRPAGWAHGVRLTPPPPMTPDQGPTVAVDGERLLVGTPSPPFAIETHPGAVWVYERSEGAAAGWALVGELEPPAESPPGFGRSLALAGDVAVVGSGALSAPPEPSAAWVYERGPGGDWSLVQTLGDDGAASDTTFGFSVALSGPRLLIGAPNDVDPSGARTGAAYLFEQSERGHWLPVRKLLPAQGAAQDRFGFAVALDGSLAAVGAPFHPVAPPTAPSHRPTIGPGAVYLFAERAGGPEGWGLAHRMVAIDGESQPAPSFPQAPRSSALGHAVGLSDGMLLAGAPFDDNENGVDAGAVYILGLDHDGDGVPDAEDVCPDTPGSDADAGVPAVHLKPGRWVHEGGVFVGGQKPACDPAPLDLHDTGGCSCAQIIERMDPGGDQARFGCSVRLLEAWAACVAEGSCPGPDEP